MYQLAERLSTSLSLLSLHTYSYIAQALTSRAPSCQQLRRPYSLSIPAPSDLTIDAAEQSAAQPSSSTAQ